MLKYILKYILVAVFIIPATTIFSQGNFELGQRWFNESLYNPAAAGNSFTTSFFLHARQQWLGMANAPSTQAVSFDSYAEPINSGFGLSISADRMGKKAIISTYNVRLMYSYYIPIANRSALSFGLSAGMLSRNRSVSGAIVEEDNDPELAYGNASDFSPSFDVGTEYRGPFKAGFTVRNLGIKSDPAFGGQTINMWGYISSRFNVTPAISIEPVGSVQYRSKTMWYEAGSLFYFMKTQSRDRYSDKFWVGATYHSNQTLSVMAGVNINPKFRLGYSFGYGMGEISALSKGGSHEIFLAYQLNRMFYKDELCPAYRNRGSVGKRR